MCCCGRPFHALLAHRWHWCGIDFIKRNKIVVYVTKTSCITDTSTWHCVECLLESQFLFLHFLCLVNRAPRFKYWLSKMHFTYDSVKATHYRFDDSDDFLLKPFRYFWPFVICIRENAAFLKFFIDLFLDCLYALYIVCRPQHDHSDDDDDDDDD